jgi:hypothetical protein
MRVQTSERDRCAAALPQVFVYRNVSRSGVQYEWWHGDAASTHMPCMTENRRWVRLEGGRAKCRMTERDGYFESSCMAMHHLN